MSGPLEIWSLVLYCLQQVGMLLGVGAQCVLLVVFLFAARDATISNSEEHFMRILRRVIGIGFFLIATSGGGITYIHMISGQSTIVMEPAFLLKWLLLFGVLILAIVHSKASMKGAFLEGVMGGMWLALLMLHISAPLSSWIVLLIAFTIWMVVFTAVWLLGFYVVSGKKFFQKKVASEILKRQSAPDPKKELPVLASPTAPPAPAPVPPKPAPVSVSVPPPPPIPKPASPLPSPARVPSTPIAAPTFTTDDEVFAYKKMVVDPTNILHPHLTGEDAWDTGDETSQGGMSMHTAEVTEHLPAVRIMPTSQEDLDTQQRGPVVKFG